MAIFCSECSREVGEQLFATASRVDQWLLLEYAGAWGGKAIPESDLAPEIKARLMGWANIMPNTETSFIKHGDQQKTGAKIRFFVALTSETYPVLYKFELDGYESLLTFDLEAVLRRDSQFEANIERDPILIICTNGRRDVSCAKYGLPIYNAFAAQTPGWAWQVTHFGGHRFAGTLTMLPDGIMYGRVDMDDVPALIEAQRDRYVVIEKLRGRSCYDEPIQAADYYLRGITGERTITGLRFVSIREEGESAWSVRFDSLADHQCYEVHVRSELSTWVSYKSSSDPEPRQLPQFHLVEHHEVKRKAPRCEG